MGGVARQAGPRHPERHAPGPRGTGPGGPALSSAGRRPRRVLVTGGAGYVGSHTVRALQRDGIEAVVFDNLSRGHRRAVGSAELVEGDLADAGALLTLLAGRRFDAVVHLAALAYVGESVADPALYYETNVGGTLNVLRAMRTHGVSRLVWSSTSAVYGVPREVPIPEDHPLQPVNPYGASKLMVERLLADYDRAYGIRSVTLRYFNAAGAEPDGTLGELHEPESHLIPRVLLTALGHYPDLEILGTDYPTPDGTCVRDYVHVSDLATAHVLALDWLDRHERSGTFNLGTERGYSVQEVVALAREVTGRPIAARGAPRRPGDPPALVSRATRARTELGWVPRLPELRQILETAWVWHRGRALPA